MAVRSPWTGWSRPWRCASPAGWRRSCPTTIGSRHEWGTAYGAHCLVLALDRPLTSTYWMNVNDPGFPFMALVEHTNYMSPADYGGRHLVYLGNYRPMDDPLPAHAHPRGGRAVRPPPGAHQPCVQRGLG